MTTPTPADLARRFLAPQSIAIIGATAQAYKAGGRRWLSALEAAQALAARARTGPRLYPINVAGGELHGHTAYRSVREVPGPVDLAAVLVPGPHVARALDDCAAKRVPAVVMISAGFGETGAEGRAEEARLAARVRSGGGRMLGPNSAGVFSASGGVNVLGWEVPGAGERGGIGLVTQSGNMALTFTNYARAKRCGLSAVLAVGNAADLTLSELIELLLADAATRCLLVYCEGFAAGDGRRLVEVLRRAGGTKPVVLLKPGASDAGRQAALSHTGALAGDDAVAAAALAEAGVIRASEAEEAFDVALALAAGRRLAGRRLAVLSDGGGHATIVADCAGRRGLTLARFSDETGTRLREVLPARAGIGNPIDYAGVAESEPGAVPPTLAACLADPGVDGVVFAGHFGGYHLMTRHAPTQVKIAAEETAAAEAMVAMVAASAKPFLLHSEHAERGLPTLAPFFAAGVPVYGGLESAAKAMAALVIGAPPFAAPAPSSRPPAVQPTSSPPPEARAPYSAPPRGEEPGVGGIPAAAVVAPPLPDPLPRGGREAAPTRLLLEPEARARLATSGVPVPAWRVAAAAGEARAAFAALVPVGAGRVALKLASNAAVHKSDVGGVLLDIASADAAAEGFDRLAAIARRLGDPAPRVLVTSMIGRGIECLVGARRDPQFGPVVLFGAGGVLVELVHDVTCRLAPFDEATARDLIADTKVARLLAGYRGTAPADSAALARLLAAVSRFAADAADLADLDLNPVIVDASGAHVADARMVLSS